MHSDLCISQSIEQKKKFTVQLGICRVNDDLLMKENCLWVLEDKNNRLWLKLIKEVHNQPAVGHLGTKQMLNMICRHYY